MVEVVVERLLLLVVVGEQLPQRPLVVAVVVEVGQPQLAPELRPWVHWLPELHR